MAVIQWSGLVTGLKGKLQGSVFQNWGGQSIIRTNKNFNKPQSPAWNYEKSILHYVSSQWRNLTAGQRLSWEAATVNFPTVDKYGNARDPSGYELFIKLNVQLQFYGVAFQVAPPAVYAFPNIGTVTTGLDAGGLLSIAYTTTFTANERLSIYAMPQVSAGRNLALGRFAFLLQGVDDASNTIDFETQYIARFGPLISGQKVWTKVFLTDIVSGQHGAIFYSSFVLP